MITKFKNKEQLAAERRKKAEGELKEFFSEKDYKRICRVFRDEAHGDDRLVISNIVIKTKFKLREIYIKLNELYEEIEISKNILELDLRADNRKQDEEYLKLLNKQKENLKEMIFHYGALLVHSCIPLLDKYFSESEIIQILGGSYSQAKRIKEYYNKKKTGTRSITDSFIIHHIEYRWKKGRCKDFIDCPDYEMPLFNCVSTYMWKEINADLKIKSDMDKVFEDTFGDIMSYATFDSKGNVVSTEKVFQKLTHNEIIRDYQGAFVNELKQKNIFDSETIYTIKKIDTGVYSVIGEDKEVIATVYKKIS